MTTIPILHFITELSIGGAQKALLRLLQGIDLEQFPSQVCCLYNGDGVVAHEIRSLGIPVADLGMKQQKWRVDAFLRLVPLIRHYQPTILHTWMFHANIPGRVVGRLAGVPIIVSAERTMGQEGTARLQLNRLTATWADRILCNAQQVATFATNTIGLPANKITVIPNGLDLQPYENLPSQADARAQFQLPATGLLVVAVGRPRPVKGYPLLLSAWAELQPQFPSAHLVFVGDGPDVTALRQQAHDLHISDHVIFMGDQTNIPRLLPAFDLLAMPSHHEGMPNVVMEAMAAGLPVVATDVGGTAEVIVANETGLLIPPNNVPALQQALIHLMSQPELRQRLGKAGKMRIQTHFSQQKTVQQTMNLYKELIRAQS